LLSSVVKALSTGVDDARDAAGIRTRSSFPRDVRATDGRAARSRAGATDRPADFVRLPDFAFVF
jgi:hypothetical protein